MPHVSYPGDISVTGQRRSNASESFPSTGSIGWYGDPRPPMTDTAPDGTPDEQPPDPFNPCNYETTKREWNADAAAAQAKKEFERRAAARGDTGLYSREWWAFIYETPNGNMYLGPITSGEQASVEPDTQRA